MPGHAPKIWSVKEKLVPTEESDRLLAKPEKIEQIRLSGMLRPHHRKEFLGRGPRSRDGVLRTHR